MRALGIAAVVGLSLLPGGAWAAPMDGSTPVLCAFATVSECSRTGECQRSSAEEANVPPFIRVDFAKKMLSTVDGARTSPIINVQRDNGRLMLQGMQNQRVWGAVIEEQTGQIAATIGEHDGAIMLSGSCVAP